MNLLNTHANFNVSQKKSSLSDNHDSFMTSTPKASPRKNKLEMSRVNGNYQAFREAINDPLDGLALAQLSLKSRLALF